MTAVIGPRIGVIIPTFNRLHFLKEALDSVLKQSYGNFQILVADNASTDGTAAFMADVCDPRVKYAVHPENLGLAGSINRSVGLLDESIGWCTVLCDDDFLHPDFLHSMAGFLEKKDASVVVDSGRILVGPDGNRLRNAKVAPPLESAMEYLLERSRLKRETFLTGVVFSRQAFQAVGGYPRFSTGMAADDAFIFSLALLDGLHRDSNAVAFIRMHQSSESNELLEASRHIPALSEFHQFVIGKMQSSRLSAPERAILAIGLEHYIRHLGSSLWLRTARAAMRLENGAREERVQELFGAIEQYSFCVSWRVRVSAFLLRRFGFSPEVFFPYRGIWFLLNKGRRMFT